MGAGEEYVAVGDPVKRTAFITLGLVILMCDVEL
jgi:hypothetical protein